MSVGLCDPMKSFHRCVHSSRLSSWLIGALYPWHVCSLWLIDSTVSFFIIDKVFVSVCFFTFTFALGSSVVAYTRLLWMQMCRVCTLQDALTVFIRYQSWIDRDLAFLLFFFCLIRFVYVTECNLIMFASCVSFYLIVIVVVLLFWFNSPHLTGSVWWWWLIEWPSTVWIVARVYADPLGKRSFGICVCAWSIERNVSLCHDCCIESLHSRWWFHWPPHRQSLNLNVWFRYTACLHNNQLPWSLSGNRRTRTPTCTFAHKLIVIHNWPF